MSEKKEGTDNPVEASADADKEYQKGFSDGQKGFLDSFFSMFKAEKVDSKAETPTKEAEKSVKSDEKTAEKKADVVEEYVYVNNEELMAKLYEIEDKINKLLGTKESSDKQKELLSQQYGADSAENKAETDKPAEIEQKEAPKEVEKEAKNDAKEVHTWLPANTWAGSENNENTLEAMQAKLKGVK